MNQTRRTKRAALRCLFLASLALGLAGCSKEGGGERRDAGADAGERDSGSAPPVGPGFHCSESAECVEDDDTHGLACVGGSCGCLTDADCDDEVCDPTTHGCVECVGASDCASDRPICAENSCVSCVTAADCASSSEGRVCAFGTCACGSDAECPSGSQCRNGDCEVTCHSDAECTDSFYGPSCDEATGVCVGCVDDADCVAHGDDVNGYGAACLDGNQCGCLDDDDCAANAISTQCHPLVEACLP